MTEITHNDDGSALDTWATENEATDLPMVILPGGGQSITEAAKRLFSLIAPTRQVFVRGSRVMLLARRDDGTEGLELLTANAARSYFERHVSFFAYRSSKGGEKVRQSAVCSVDTANAFLESKEARDLLPHVSGLINCPIIYEKNEELSVAGRGYDELTKILVTDGGEVLVVELAEAVQALQDLLAEFNFQTEGDRSRAIASMITPALVVGGFIKHRVPADVAEADQSQSGKTYRQRVIAALYNEKMSLVTNREGGVGSVDESFSQALISGRPFIQLDNFRGKLNSPHIEAFLTAEGSFPCRVPYQGQIDVRPENFFVSLSSNGVDTTRDFANRSNIIRIQKQRPGFEFTKFEEGDLLDRVRFWQPYYLGCIFAVVREWHRQGKQRTNEANHDFRHWVQILDWIVQNIFKIAPIMEGHREAQERVSNPQLIWLRQFVLAAAQAGDTERDLTATEIQKICQNHAVVVPGLRDTADEDTAKRFVGSVLGRLFGKGDCLPVDGYQIARSEKILPRANHVVGGGTRGKVYRITPLGVATASASSTP